MKKLQSIGLSFAAFGVLALVSCETQLAEIPEAIGESLSPSKASNKLPVEASPRTIARSKIYAKDKHGMPTYTKHSERTRYVRTTSYSHMEKEVGCFGLKNAAGTRLKYGSVRSAAADWAIYPVGTTFKVKGLPYTFVVDDYGSALVGTNTIDIFHPTLRKMRNWGTRKTEITIIQWGSYKRSMSILKARTKHSHCRSMYVRCRSKLNDTVARSELTRNGAL